MKPFTEALLLLAVGLSSCPPGVRAQEPHVRAEDLTFRSGSVELAGTLVAPEGPGPFPAIVFLHGSGPSTREGARPYAETFARLGFASLVFDKRGSGDSGGSWVTASLDDLAGDGLAAMAYLRGRAEVDPERIGFWGVSQAAWVATLAAARSGDVAFMVLISGGGATPRASEMYSYHRAFDAAGLSEAERFEADSVLATYFHYLGTGEGRDRTEKAIRDARSSRWYELAPLERILPSEENRPNWSWVAAWDPAPFIRRLEMPILLMFGDKDRQHPTAIAVKKWKEGLEEAGNDDATIMIFPGAGHGIRMRAEHSGAGRAPFADGYAEAQIGWLWLHVLTAGGD